MKILHILKQVLHILEITPPNVTNNKVLQARNVTKRKKNRDSEKSWAFSSESTSSTKSKVRKISRTAVIQEIVLQIICGFYSLTKTFPRMVTVTAVTM